MAITLLQRTWHTMWMQKSKDLTHVFQCSVSCICLMLHLSVRNVNWKWFKVQKSYFPLHKVFVHYAHVCIMHIVCMDFLYFPTPCTWKSFSMYIDISIRLRNYVCTFCPFWIMCIHFFDLARLSPPVGLFSIK